MNRHPLSSIFPDLSPSQLQELCNDVKLHGQKIKGVIFEGMILDGWHRFLACKKSNLKFQYEAFEGSSADAARLVISLNLTRRHLTDNERMCIAADLAQILKKKREGRNGSTPKDQLTGRNIDSCTHTIVCKAMNISQGSYSRASYLKKHHPERFKECKEGKISVANAYRKVHLTAFQGGDISFPTSFSWWHEVDKFLKYISKYGWACKIVMQDGLYEAKFAKGPKKDKFLGESSLIRAISVAALEEKAKIGQCVNSQELI